MTMFLCFNTKYAKKPLFCCCFELSTFNFVTFHIDFYFAQNMLHNRRPQGPLAREVPNWNEEHVYNAAMQSAIPKKKQTCLLPTAREVLFREVASKLGVPCLKNLGRLVRVDLAQQAEFKWLPGGTPALDGILLTAHRACYYTTYKSMETRFPAINHSTMNELWVRILPFFATWGERYIGRANLQHRMQVGDTFMPPPFESITIIIDGSDVQCWLRRGQSYTRAYSFKLKAAAGRTQIVILPNGYIQSISSTLWAGANPDITMAANEPPSFLEDGDVCMGDLGYLGLDWYWGIPLVTQHKKPRGRQLTRRQALENEYLQVVRSLIERIIGEMKLTVFALSSNVREVDALETINLLWKFAAGVHNFKLANSISPQDYGVAMQRALELFQQTAAEMTNPDGPVDPMQEFSFLQDIRDEITSDQDTIAELLAPVVPNLMDRITSNARTAIMNRPPHEDDEYEPEDEEPSSDDDYFGAGSQDGPSSEDDASSLPGLPARPTYGPFLPVHHRARQQMPPTPQPPPVPPAPVVIRRPMHSPFPPTPLFQATQPISPMHPTPPFFRDSPPTPSFSTSPPVPLLHSPRSPWHDPPSQSSTPRSGWRTPQRRTSLQAVAPSQPTVAPFYPPHAYPAPTMQPNMLPMPQYWTTQQVHPTSPAYQRSPRPASVQPPTPSPSSHDMHNYNPNNHTPPLQYLLRGENVNLPNLSIQHSPTRNRPPKRVREAAASSNERPSKRSRYHQ